VRTLSGYSAHADQQDLVDIVTGIPTAPCEIRLVHGDAGAKAALQGLLKAQLADTAVAIR